MQPISPTRSRGHGGSFGSRGRSGGNGGVVTAGGRGGGRGLAGLFGRGSGRVGFAFLTLLTRILLRRRSFARVGIGCRRGGRRRGSGRLHLRISKKEVRQETMEYRGSGGRFLDGGGHFGPHGLRSFRMGVSGHRGGDGAFLRVTPRFGWSAAPRDPRHVRGTVISNNEEDEVKYSTFSPTAT